LPSGPFKVVLTPSEANISEKLSDMDASSEARRADSMGWGSWGRGSEPPPH